MTIWLMRIACLTPKATNTHPENIIVIVFPRNNGWMNAPQCYVIRTFTLLLINTFLLRYYLTIGFGGLEVACWPFVPKFAGSNRAKAVGFLGRKTPQHAFFGGEVKPLLSCRRFAACKRSLNLSGSRNLGKITRQISLPQFHLSRISRIVADVQVPGGESGKV